MRRPARVFTRPLVMAVAVVVCVALMAILHLALPDGLAVVLLDKGGVIYPFSIQHLTWGAFFVGLGELWLRHRDAQEERQALAAGYLPEDERTMLQAPELREIYQRVKRDADAGGRFLPRLICRVVLQFQASHSVDQSHSLLSASLDLFLHEIDLRYSVTRYIIWVIPTLGFIGTVLGISLALALVGRTDPSDPALLSSLTKELAVAFNTTLLALVLSAILVLLQHLVQEREERALNLAGDYCLDNLINRLYER